MSNSGAVDMRMYGSALEQKPSFKRVRWQSLQFIIRSNPCNPQQENANTK